MVGKQALILVVLTLISLAQEAPQKGQIPVTVKYDPIVFRAFPPRNVSPTITREDGMALESKGYVKLGSVVISYPTTGGKEEKAPGSVEETLLKEATSRGGDVVRIETANVPSMIPSGSSTQGSCIGWQKLHHMECHTIQKYETNNNASIGSTSCKSVDDGVGPCTTWEWLPVLVPGLATKGSVWRHDPKLVADIAAEDSYRRLDESIRWGDDAKVEQLLAHGADVNAKDSLGDTVLSRAVLSGRKELVELLLAHGADVNARVFLGSTALHKASFTGNANVVELLLAHGADANAKDNKGMTPLYEAVSDQHKEIVELLLAHGADVNAQNIYGWTPLRLAKANKNQDIANLLQQHGGHK